MKEWMSTRLALFTGGLAAILASTCCLGPLLLVVLGFSGSWIGNLTSLEPYKPWFISLAFGSMVIAWRRIYHPVCREGEVCGMSGVNITYKVLFWNGVALIGIALLSPYLLPFFYD